MKIKGTIHSDSTGIFYIKSKGKKYRLHPDIFYVKMNMAICDADGLIGMKAQGMLDAQFKPPEYFTYYDGIINSTTFELI